MVLTIKSAITLEERLRTMSKSFRRLLDIRVGKTNRKRIQREIKKHLRLLVEQKSLTQDMADQWLRATDSWLDYCVREERINGKSFKLRDLFEGLSSLEVTYGKISQVSTLLRKLAKIGLPNEEQKRVNALKRSLTDTEGIGQRIEQLTTILAPLETVYGYQLKHLVYQLNQVKKYWLSPDGWHVHRHLIVHMRYMPTVVLSTLWSWATKGEGTIVDIRSVKNVADGVRETIKYTTKPWEIPEDKQDELLKAMCQ